MSPGEVVERHRQVLDGLRRDASAPASCTRAAACWAVASCRERTMAASARRAWVTSYEDTAPADHCSSSSLTFSRWISPPVSPGALRLPRPHVGPGQTLAHPSSNLPGDRRDVQACGVGQMARLRLAVATFAGRLDRDIEVERQDPGRQEAERGGGVESRSKRDAGIWSFSAVTMPASATAAPARARSRSGWSVRQA